MAPDGSRFDVLFVGTSTGQLIKAVNSLAPKSRISARTVIIEEIELMSNPVKIGKSQSPKLTHNFKTIHLEIIEVKVES